MIIIAKQIRKWNIAQLETRTSGKDWAALRRDEGSKLNTNIGICLCYSLYDKKLTWSSGSSSSCSKSSIMSNACLSNVCVIYVSRGQELSYMTMKREVAGNVLVWWEEL